jgi:hypothetical protein
MRGFGRLRWVILIQAAAAGLVAGHFLDYWIVAPDGQHRSALLDVTGHGYLNTAATLAVFVAISAVMASIGAGATRRRTGRVRRPSWRAAAARLAVLQGVGFVVVESVERVAAGAAPSGFGVRVLAVGLLVQAAIAVITALLLSLLERTGAAIATLLAARFAARRAPLVLGREPERVTLRDRIAEGSLQSRAPPVLLHSV